MSIMPSKWSSLKATHAAHREELRERRQLEHDLASFVTPAERMEIAALLERPIDTVDEQTIELLSNQVFAPSQTHAAA